MAAALRPALQVVWLGRVPYAPVYALQRRLVKDHRAEVVLALEHTPTYTVGRRITGNTAERDRLRALGADYFETHRGGLITFHGPGQLVLYPIVDLRRYQLGVRTYVDALQGALVDTCAYYGIDAALNRDVGVWVGNDKIAAIGVQVSGGITRHGLALNCTTDLTWFQHIVPCGLHGKGVTSLLRVLQGGDPPNVVAQNVETTAVLPILTRALATRMGATAQPASRELRQHIFNQLDDLQRNPPPVTEDD